MDITRLHCEYREQPLGIDHPQPRLGWELASDVRGAKQTAYRVLVASTAEGLKDNQGDLWDSGKVVSNQSVGVTYAGAPLASGQRCFWKVKVWDNDGTASEWSAPAFWEMGLLKASDWKAEWISDGKPMPEKDEDFFRGRSGAALPQAFQTVRSGQKRATLHLRFGLLPRVAERRRGRRPSA